MKTKTSQARKASLSAKLSTLLLAASGMSVAMTACDEHEPTAAYKNAGAHATSPANPVLPTATAKAPAAAAANGSVPAPVAKPANPCAPSKPKKKKSCNPCA